jgi:hypothetical protein
MRSRRPARKHDDLPCFGVDTIEELPTSDDDADLASAQRGPRGVVIRRDRHEGRGDLVDEEVQLGADVDGRAEPLGEDHLEHLRSVPPDRIGAKVGIGCEPDACGGGRRLPPATALTRPALLRRLRTGWRHRRPGRLAEAVASAAALTPAKVPREARPLLALVQQGGPTVATEQLA